MAYSLRKRRGHTRAMTTRRRDVEARALARGLLYGLPISAMLWALLGLALYRLA